MGPDAEAGREVAARPRVDGIHHARAEDEREPALLQGHDEARASAEPVPVRGAAIEMPAPGSALDGDVGSVERAERQDPATQAGGLGRGMA